MFVTCVLNPVVLIVFAYLDEVSENDEHGLATMANHMTLLIWLGYCAVYVLVYSWIGKRPSSSWVMFAKGVLLTVIAFPIVLFLASFAQFLMMDGVFGDWRSGVGTFMLFGGPLGAIPVGLAALVSLLMTRLIFFRRAADPTLTH